MKFARNLACTTVALAWTLPLWELVTRRNGFFGHRLGWGYMVSLDWPIAITLASILLVAGTSVAIRLRGRGGR